MHFNVVALPLFCVWFFWLTAAAVIESRKPYQEASIKRYNLWQAPIYFLIACLLVAYLVYNNLEEVTACTNIRLFWLSLSAC